ncbi:MAG: hypothetical protein H0X47_04490 [Nitrospirales bacterium]|nr:hypothetical protein [Nitrospirales bacterium]
MEAVKGGKTVQQLRKDFQVHPSPITIWKQQLTGQVAELLKRQARAVVAVGDEALRQAYEKIGRLDIKLNL